jgi:signal transduction histidine kinase
VYAAYSVLALLRDTVESNLYPVSMLLLDGVFFLLCALHPSEQGLWLATVAYFYLLTFSALLYEWWHVCGVVGGSMFFFALFRPQPSMWLWPAVVLGGVLAIVLALHKHSFQDRLSAALKRSVLSRSEAETARESERQRIADDFHDGPLQSFISFQMRLEIIRKLLERDRDAAMRELMQLQDLGRAQVTELRSFVRGMQPADVSPNNLQSAIREAVEHFERDSGIDATLICGDLSILEEGAASEFLQIVREALNNVRKHSKASEVSIVIEASDNGVDLIVEDDGSGFPFSGAYTLDELEILRLGPRSIKRRVRTLGGDLTINSRPPAGSVVRVHIPA